MAYVGRAMRFVALLLMGAAGTDPSLIGAFVGAAAGAAAGVGLEHLITEEMGQSLGNGGTVVLFAVAQGILAAAGSRLVARVTRR
ncbi:MAG: hypothetical protein M3303_02075 [Gemmatimonadota bacterium]|nr:hypothetical protein [Gemmatimonadota bacterium]